MGARVKRFADGRLGGKAGLGWRTPRDLPATAQAGLYVRDALVPRNAGTRWRWLACRASWFLHGLAQIGRLVSSVDACRHRWVWIDTQPIRHRT